MLMISNLPPRPPAAAAESAVGMGVGVGDAEAAVEGRAGVAGHAASCLLFGTSVIAFCVVCNPPPCHCVLHRLGSLGHGVRKHLPP